MEFCKSFFKFNSLISFGVIFCLIFVAAGCTNSSPAKPTSRQTLQTGPYNKTIKVGSKTISVQVATTASEMSLGLSGRKNMGDDQGMLFDFKQTQTANFWMKDMNFDLDLIWIKNKKIVGITHDVPHPKSPKENLPVYSSPGEIDMVLEVNAEWSERNKIKIGDSIISTE